MKRGLTRGWIALAVAGMFLTVGAAEAQQLLAGKVSDVVEPLGPNGSVDWTTGVVMATGQGAPPANAANAAQARAMAERAATVVAYRNLLEVVKGVRVDSMSLVENMILTSDVIKTQVSGMVQGAQPIQKKRHEDGMVEVTVAMKLTGDLANLLLPKDIPHAAPIPSQPAQAPSDPDRAFTAQPGSDAPVPSGQAAAGAVYTGLIVDARGVGVRPAMAPKIRNEEGREVYGSAYVGRQYAVEQGMMGYLKDLSAAQSNPRVTDRPFLVKALKADGPNKTDLVISNKDAQILHSMKENLNFLEKARVMVVLD